MQKAHACVFSASVRACGEEKKSDAASNKENWGQKEVTYLHNTAQRVVKTGFVEKENYAHHLGEETVTELQMQDNMTCI